MAAAWSAGVLPVGDVLAPDRGGGGVAAGVVDGEVFHEGVGGGAVPVFLAGRAPDGLPGVGFDLLAVAGADPGDALKDMEVWPRGWVCQAVRAPGEKRTLETMTVRPSARGTAIGSSQTSPEKFSAGSWSWVYGCRAAWWVSLGRCCRGQAGSTRRVVARAFGLVMDCTGLPWPYLSW